MNKFVACLAPGCFTARLDSYRLDSTHLDSSRSLEWMMFFFSCRWIVGPHGYADCALQLRPNSRRAFRQLAIRDTFRASECATTCRPTNEAVIFPQATQHTIICQYASTHLRQWRKHVDYDSLSVSIPYLPRKKDFNYCRQERKEKQTKIAHWEGGWCSFVA